MGSAEDEIGDGVAKYAKLRPMSLKRLNVESRLTNQVDRRVKFYVNTFTIYSST